MPDGPARAGAGYTRDMLTRSGVAKRLGKSIATVRRMEGVELHPVVDARGVHRFNPDEVERVARGDCGAGPKAHRIADLQAHKETAALFPPEPVWDEGDALPTAHGGDPMEEAHAYQAAIRREYEAVRERFNGGVLKHEAEYRATLEKKRQEKREAALAEKEAIAEDLLRMLESASDAELAAIGEEGLEELVDLLEADD